MRRRSRAGGKPAKSPRGKQAALKQRNAPKVTRLTPELSEARDQQAATSEVLRIISSSPTDAQPVFDTIARSAARLCKAQFCYVFRFDGKLIHFAAQHGLAPKGVEAIRRVYPIVPGRVSAAARSILSGTIEEIPDIHADHDYEHGHTAKIMAYRSIVAVPMLKDGRPIGAIAMARSQTGRFPDRQVELLKTFADQAVIAVENVRLFKAEQQRTGELSESLEQQTAISEVLKVISGSPTDIQPVLDAVGENAARLCEANNAVIFRLEGNLLRHVASYGHIPTTSHPLEGLPVSRDTVTGRAVFDRRTIHVHDLSAEDHEYPEGSRHAKVDGHRTTLATPLLREGVPVGAILIRRMEVRPFSPKQIHLVTTFADQAAIAIENTRLLNELRQRTDDLTESLEQQTATAEVLKVISSSPGELDSIFQAMLEKAVSICEAEFGALYRYERGAFQPAAMRNAPPPYADFVRSRGRFLPQTGNSLDRLLQTKRTVHTVDQLAEKVPTPSAKLGGARSQIAVPMLKEGDLIGVISIYRQEVRPFTDKQIELVQNFAAQAVIATENARLLNE